MNNAPRHPKTQIGLYQPGIWQLGILGGPQSPDYEKYMEFVFIVDEAIERAREQKQ